MAASIGVTSKKSPMTERLKNGLSLAAAFVLGVLVVFLCYHIFGGTSQPAAVVPGGGGGGGGDGDGTETTTTSKPKPGLLIKDLLLPKDARPSRYDLRMKTYLPGYGAAIPKDRELSYDGNVVIHLTAEKDVGEVTLHAVDLTFDKEQSFVQAQDGSRVAITEIEVKDKLQFAVFKLAQAVKGEFLLTIAYQGKIRPELAGLYQTKYTNGRGEQKIAAATQMEPLDARKMVPCFDEPEWKAIWNVTLVHPKGTTAISNGIELGEPQPADGDFLQTSFQDTPAMSSYLLAVVVSDFVFNEGKTKRGIRFRIWSRPEAKQTTDYALQAGIKCLEGLEEFYGVEFPLKKQDMVALPDFAMGAMENWGLITYRETALLYDAKNYNMENKRRVATVIAHELAHMWFGDLVTMKWWDDIWLNEGFAAFVENIGVDIIADNKFDMETTFVTEQHSYSLSADSSRSSHPIVNKVDSAEEIMDLFDTISYKKGASFISMVNHLMEKENFMSGIKSYFEKYSYKNAEHAQLFAELDKAVPAGMTGPDGKTQLNITEFALKWTLQMGYPYLSLVSHNATHDEVTQTRYLVNPNATEQPKFANPKYIWDVPVWYQVGPSKDVRLAWLPYEGHLYLPKTSEALVLNADSYAIARMNYDEVGWRKILEQLKQDNTVYSQRTKYRIVSDVFAMAEIEKISYDLALDFSQYVVKEEGRLPWYAFLEQISTIRNYYGSSPASQTANNYVKKLLEPIVKSIDIDSIVASIVDEESHIAKQVLVTQWATFCRVSPKDCLAKKKQIFDEKFRQPCSGNDLQSSECTQVPNPIRNVIYCDAVQYGDEDVFNLILSKYKKELLQLESVKLMDALCCTQSVVRIKWLLEETALNRDRGIIRGQEAGSIFSQLAKNEVAAELLLDFFLEHWDQIYKNYVIDQSLLSQMITYSAKNIRTRYQLEKLKSFVKSDENAKKYYTFTKAEQDAQKKISWLEKNGRPMAELLQKKTGQL